MSGVFECGDGRISELLSRWLGRLGLTPRTFVQQMEAVAGDSEDALVSSRPKRDSEDAEEVTGARRLVEAARGCWPHSSEVREAGIFMGALNYTSYSLFMKSAVL